MRRSAQAAMDKAAQHPEDFADAFESAFERLQVRIEMACISEEEWPAQVAVAVREALAFAAADPAAAWVLTNRAMSGDTTALRLFDQMTEHVAAGLMPGRAERPAGEWLPEITEKAMVCGVASLIAQRLQLGRHEELPTLAREAIQFVLTPYLGTDEAIAIAIRYGA